MVHRGNSILFRSRRRGGASVQLREPAFLFGRAFVHTTAAIYYRVTRTWRSRRSVPDRVHTRRDAARRGGCFRNFRWIGTFVKASPPSREREKEKRRRGEGVVVRTRIFCLVHASTETRRDRGAQPARRS